MSKQNYIVYDFETGGLNPKVNAVTEVAMISIDGEKLEEIDRYTTFIQPYGDLGYDQRALDITGITMDMINSGKDAKTVVKEMSDFIVNTGKGRGKKPILCGHKIVTFDNLFAEVLFKTHRKDFYSLINNEVYIDTMWWSRMRSPIDEDEHGKHALSAACNRAGIELTDGHRAMNDTASNSLLVVEYLKSLRGAGGATEIVPKHIFRDHFKF